MSGSAQDTCVKKLFKETIVQNHSWTIWIISKMMHNRQKWDEMGRPTPVIGLRFVVLCWKKKSQTNSEQTADVSELHATLIFSHLNQEDTILTSGFIVLLPSSTSHAVLLSPGCIFIRLH